MSKIVVFESLTLEGVMQAPGRPDEDRRGNFEHGGWASPYADEVMGRLAAEGMANIGALLLGSGELGQSLMRHNLVDEYILLIHPVVLGSGRWLFRDDASFAKLQLTDSVTTTTSVVIATYQPAHQA